MAAKTKGLEPLEVQRQSRNDRNQRRGEFGDRVRSGPAMGRH